MMQKKVEAEGETQHGIHDKFMCYCKTATSDLSKGVEEAKIKIPDLESAIEEGKSVLKQLKSDITSHKTDRSAAKTAIAEATGIREKERAAYEKEKAENKADLEAVTKAVKALEKGLGSFLQTSTAAVLQKVVNSREDMLGADREDILAFLQDRDGSPGTSEIVGILKQMEDEMSKDLADAKAEEDNQIVDYEGLVAAKKKEIQALSGLIETKLQRVGDLSVKVTEASNELEETQAALAEDEQFSLNIGKECSKKAKEWDVIEATRKEELLALSETIKMLNDDDALELFKKTLPGSASFLQIQVTSKELRSRALEALRAVKGNANTDFVALTLKGKKVGFEKVIALVDKLSADLKKEQTDDDAKRVYCAKEFDKSDDKKKDLEHQISDTKTSLAKAKEEQASLQEDIAALTEGIKALDQSVTEATAMRKQENAEYTELMASNGIAKQVLEFAMNRLNKFYNPKMYKAPPKRELSEADAITVGMGGELAPTEAPGGIAGTGIGASFVQFSSRRGAPPPPPEAVEAYSTKSEEATGALQMIRILVTDLDKEMNEAEFNEKDGQEDYEKFVAESAEKRATDSKLVEDKDNAFADAQAQIGELKSAERSGKKELAATLKYISVLHGDCDWLVKYYDVRKQARAAELDSLSKAKAVLNGADYSLLQIQSTRRSFRGA